MLAKSWENILNTSHSMWESSCNHFMPTYIGFYGAHISVFFPFNLSHQLFPQFALSPQYQTMQTKDRKGDISHSSLIANLYSQ